MMRVSVLLACVGLVIGAWSPDPASAQVRQERCDNLRGGAENPPVVSDGTGRFRLNIRPNGNLAWRLRYNFPDPETMVMASHIHIGNPGNNGGIAVFLCTDAEDPPPGVPTCGDPEDEISRTIVPDDVQEVTADSLLILEAGDLEGLTQLIRDGAAYVNVHTADFPSGELRCQIGPRRR